MSSTSGTIRDTVRETTRDVKEAARESGKAASAASGDIQADLQALRDDVTRLATQIADIFAAKGDVAPIDSAQPSTGLAASGVQNECAAGFVTSR
jgi:hypothetical protein